MNTVASLPAKWRAKSSEIAKPYGFVTELVLGKAHALEHCADELEAALPSPAPSAGVGVGDGWALTKLRAHESRCGECGRAVWDGKDQAACIGFLAPCGKRIARLEDCGTGVSPALPAGLDLPSATEWTQNNEVAASFDWMAGWDACRVEYPHRISSAPWRREWQGSGDQRGFHIVEAVRLTHNRRIAYLGDQVSGEAVDAIIAAHNATATAEQPGSAVQRELERMRAVLEAVDDRGQMLDDLCTANARWLFRTMNPGADDDEIEYEQSHEVTAEAVRRLAGSAVQGVATGPLLTYAVEFMTGWLEGESEEVLRQWDRVKAAVTTPPPDAEQGDALAEKLRKAYEPDDYEDAFKGQPEARGVEGMVYGSIAHRLYCEIVCNGDPECFNALDIATQRRWVDGVEKVLAALAGKDGAK